MTFLPELVESSVLFTASGWMFHLYGRSRLRALLFAAAFILLPAIGLLVQGLGAPTTHVELSKWAVVGANLMLTLALIRVTWDEESASSKLLELIHKQEAEIKRMHDEMRCRLEVSERANAAIRTPLGESNAIRIRQLLSEVPCG